MKQTTISPEEEPETIEVPDQWEIEQGFIDDQRELDEEEKAKLNDPTRYFKCYRCHRKVDRTKEFLMQFSGGNQTLGLANILRDFCWNCYWIVKREAEGRLSGLSGREFAFVVTETKNQRRNF